VHKEKQKINAIINELLSFLLKNGATEVNINVKDTENYTEIKFLGNISNIDNSSIEYLRDKLQVSRAAEIEDYYGRLVGSVKGQDDLYILGTMIDKSVVYYKDSHGISIIVCREK